MRQPADPTSEAAEPTILPTPDADAPLLLILRLLCVTFSADAAVLWRSWEFPARFAVSRQVDVPDSILDIPPSPETLRALCQTGSRQIGGAAEDDPDDQLETYVRSSGYSNALAIPLSSPHGTFLGSLWVLHSQPWVLTAEAERQLADFGNLIARRIEERQRNREAERAQEALREIASRAACILWRAEAFEVGEPHLRWRLRLSDHEAAARFLQIEIPPGMSFAAAWKKSRLPEDDARIDAYGTQEVRAGRSYTQDFRCRRADGEIRWLSEDVSVETVGPGHWVATGVCTDITERKAAEVALRESRERLERLLTSARVIPWEMDSDQQRFLYVGPQAVRLLGYPLDAWYEEGFWLRNVHPDERDAVTALLNGPKRGGSDEEIECRMLASDGRTVWIRAIGSLSQSAAGNSILRGFLFDITEHKLLEEQLRQAQRLEAVGRLAGGVAHDFNNMLAVITGYSDLLVSSLAPDHPAQPGLEQIRRAGGRAAALTRQLLAYSRKQVLQPRILDLNEVLDRMHQLLRRLIGADVDLVTLPQPGIWPVRADPGQVEQVIVNLAVNSRDAMPDGGKLTLVLENVEVRPETVPANATFPAGRYVRMTVRDTGTGMDAITQAQIFEPFFTTKEPGKGTGLGLSTVYGIIHQSGGQVEVESQFGEGTEFRLYLPALEGEAANGEDAEPDPVATPRREGTILLVEDERMLRELLSEVLASQGYEVLTAMQGDEALRICEEYGKPIHLLLTDVVMPRMSGLELAERARLLRPDMAVIFMSGYSDVVAGRSGVLDARTPLLQKPFSPMLLVEKVHEVLLEHSLRTSPGPRGHVLLIDDDLAAVETLAEVLSLEGYRVTTASNGVEAMKLLQEPVKPDAILVDLIMPEMNGWVFRMEQQKDANLSHIPTFVLSGAEDTGAVATFLGVTDHFRKPVDIPQLLSALERTCSATVDE